MILDEQITSELRKPRYISDNPAWTGRYWCAERRWFGLVVDLVEYQGALDMAQTTGRRITLSVVRFWLLCRRVSKARREIGALPQARIL